jgi:hypothetical protein
VNPWSRNRASTRLHRVRVPSAHPENRGKADAAGVVAAGAVTVMSLAANKPSSRKMPKLQCKNHAVRNSSTPR